jgi:hypothetical protein
MASTKRGLGLTCDVGVEPSAKPRNTTLRVVFATKTWPRFQLVLALCLAVLVDLEPVLQLLRPTVLLVRIRGASRPPGLQD